MDAVFNDRYFMKQALVEAEKAVEQHEVPVGAIVVASGKMIAKAHNLTETLNDVTAHAEMLAMTSATEALGGKYLNDCTLYVTLEPCLMCAGAMAWAQLGRLVYGTEDEKRGYSRLTEKILHPKTKVSGGVMKEECTQIVKDFFRKKR